MLRIVIWKDVLEVISTEIWFNNQNTLIHIDSSGFLYVILAWYAMKKCMHKIENIPLQPSSFYSWGGGVGAWRSWNWLMHYRQPLFALNPWSTVLLCREHNILTILLWNTTVYMYMCDLYIIHLVRVVFLLQKGFPLITWGVASVKFYLKALCFVFHTAVRSLNGMQFWCRRFSQSKQDHGT